MFRLISDSFPSSAVRFGRVPKKEKARIIEQMQKVNLQSATTQMSSILISTQDLVQSVIVAHKQTCDLYQEKVAMMRDIAMMKNDYVDCPAHMVGEPTIGVYYLSHVMRKLVNRV